MLVEGPQSVGECLAVSLPSLPIHLPANAHLVTLQVRTQVIGSLYCHICGNMAPRSWFSPGLAPSVMGIFFQWKEDSVCVCVLCVCVCVAVPFK